MNKEDKGNKIKNLITLILKDLDQLERADFFEDFRVKLVRCSDLIEVLEKEETVGDFVRDLRKVLEEYKYIDTRISLLRRRSESYRQKMRILRRIIKNN